MGILLGLFDAHEGQLFIVQRFQKIIQAPVHELVLLDPEGRDAVAPWRLLVVRLTEDLCKKFLHILQGGLEFRGMVPVSKVGRCVGMLELKAIHYAPVDEGKEGEPVWKVTETGHLLGHRPDYFIVFGRELHLVC